jgi:two-component system, NarL family, nitrate/nitrite response regulator NarL
MNNFQEKDSLNKIRVVIADDHPLIRSGIRTELSRYPEFEVVGEALDGDEALRLAQELRPNVLILDINMPGMRALKVLQELKREADACRVLVLTAYGDTATILGIIKAGADGYLLKDEESNAIPEAIRAILAGETWLSRSISGQLVSIIRGEKVPKLGEELTAREKEVLAYLGKGCTNKEIAAELQTSEKTIEFHVSNILDKLGIRSRVEAVIWAKEHGLV